MAKKKRKSKPATAGVLIVQSKVKEYARAKNFRVAGDLVDALSEEVEIMLDAAMERAESNGRSTIRADDL